MTERIPAEAEPEMEPQGGGLVHGDGNGAAPTAGAWPPGPTGWQPPQTDEDEEGGIDFSRYLAAAYRFKWFILAITILGTVGGVFGSRFLRPVYRAGGTLWVEKTDKNGGSPTSGPIRSGQLLDAFSWVQLLRTFEVLEYVARGQRLFLISDHNADREKLSNLELTDSFYAGRYRFEVDQQGEGFTLQLVGGGLERGTFGDSTGGQFGIRWAPMPVFAPGSVTEFGLRHPRDAAMAISNSLNAQLGRDGNLMTVELDGQDPEKTAGILNSILLRFIDLAADLKRARLTTERQILDEQVAVAQRNLASAEQALEQFRVNTITLPTERSGPVPAGIQETRDPVFANFFRMNIELEEKRHDRRVLDEILSDAPNSGIPIDRLGAVAAALSSRELEGQLDRLIELRSELATLQLRYTDQHQAVQKVTGDLQTLEHQTIPGQMRRLIAALDQQITDLEGRLEFASRNLEAIPERSIEETRLKRAVEIADKLYTDLRQRLQAANLAEASSMPDVSILDRAAVPQVPISNRAPMVVLMGGAGSLAVAFALAFLLDKLDRRLRYPEEVTKGLGLLLLGTIPRADQGRGSKRVVQVAQVVEALRGIRLNLVHSCGVRGHLAITVTSPGAGDGKSFVASNLALAFAEAGYRTVVVDADTRRGQLHRLFGRERRPGLTDLLTGTRKVAEVLNQTEFNHLAVVPCGTRSSRAPEMLGSASMERFLTGLKARYDVVIVDSPPMGAGVDSLTLGSLTGNLLLVLRTGATDREMTQMKLSVAERLPIRVVGAVLNDVSTSSTGGSYSWYGYYMPGYEAEDEAEPGVNAIGTLRKG